MAAPISDLYERYKIGTKHIVQWLAETAGKSAIGIVNNIVKVSTSGWPQNIDSIIRILEDVIAGRSECAVWYNRKTPNSEKDETFVHSQEGHQHIITVLRVVLSRLKDVLEINIITLGKGKQTHTNIAKNPPAAAKAIHNLYEDLAVEEPSVEFLAAAAAELRLRQGSPQMESAPASTPKAKKKSKKKQKKPQVSPVFELEPQAQDADFALWCFLEECHRIRLYVRGLWQDWAAGNTSFHIAAIISDKAALLIQHTAQNFIDNFPSLSTMQQVADYLNIDAKMKGSHIESFQCKGSEDASLQVEAVELLCLPAYLHLVLLRQTWDHTALESMTLPERWEHTERRSTFQSQAHPLAGMAVQLCLDWYNGGPPLANFISQVGTDVFIENLMEVPNADSLPLHTVIQFQMYMGIVEIVPPDMKAPLYAMYSTKLHIQHRIRDYESAIHELLPNSTFPASHRASCKKIMTEGLEGYAKVSKKYVNETHHIDFRFPWPVIFPVFGGTLISKLMTDIYVDGIITCDQECIVASMAHIYRACRASGLLKKPWKDMDSFISATRPEDLMLPPASWSPAALLNSAQHYRAFVGARTGQLGINATGKQNDTCRDPLPPPEQIEQHRPHLTPCSYLSEDRRATNRNLRSGNQSHNLASRNALFELAGKMMTRPKIDVSQEVHGHWKICGRLASIDLLKTLKAELEYEEIMNHHFDYHSFSLACLNMLRCMDDRRMTVHHKLPTEHSFVQLTDEILWEAAEVGMLRMRKGIDTSLGITASVINAHIKHGAGNPGSAIYDSACAIRKLTMVYDPMMELNPPKIISKDPGESSNISVTGQEIVFPTMSASEEAAQKARLASMSRYHDRSQELTREGLTPQEIKHTIRREFSEVLVEQVTHDSEQEHKGE